MLAGVIDLIARQDDRMTSALGAFRFKVDPLGIHDRDGVIGMILPGVCDGPAAVSVVACQWSCAAFSIALRMPGSICSHWPRAHGASHISDRPASAAPAVSRSGSYEIGFLRDWDR